MQALESRVQGLGFAVGGAPRRFKELQSASGRGGTEVEEREGGGERDRESERDRERESERARRGEREKEQERRRIAPSNAREVVVVLHIRRKAVWFRVSGFGFWVEALALRALG